MGKRKSKKIGNIYGQFKVIDTYCKNKDTVWIVQCQKCGEIQHKSRHSIEKGITECEKCGNPPKKRKSNGHCRERIYHIYTTMLQRTTNENKQGYERYGGSGIRVCDEWQNDFMKFYNWSIENGYCEMSTIDRIDNKGDYSPQNCRWTDARTQANNRSNNRIISAFGEKNTVAELARKYGANRMLVYQRLNRGWNAEEALTRPVDKSKRSKKYCEEVR